MGDELNLSGIGVAPGVLERIAVLATEGVDGVAAVDGGQGLSGFVHKSGAKGVSVTIDDSGNLSACLHLSVVYGRPVQEVARSVQAAVAEALSSQTGQPVAAVDLYVDGVVFAE